mmetsp:Transcript_42101/g.64562  ORF Transcript_42101/g.64562 Transcript_42101/m.64562 type:complete len:200 (+) Transcript_42101:1982-2581(+)
MDEYPEARKFYMERAWYRRIEFRRRQKKFLLQLYHEKGLIFREEEDQRRSKKSGDSSEDDDFEAKTERATRKDIQRATEVRKDIRASISRFYHNINVEDELQEDFDSDDLAEVSEDEKPDDLQELLYENHSKVGQGTAQQIQTRIEGMAALYDHLGEGLEQNLDSLSHYVAELQAQTAMGKDVEEIARPSVRKLTGLVQ